MKFRIKRVVKGDYSVLFYVEKKKLFGWKEVYHSGVLSDCDQFIKLQAKPHVDFINVELGIVVPLNLTTIEYAQLQRAASDAGQHPFILAEKVVKEFVRTYVPLKKDRF